MRFIHIADVHLGASPDIGSARKGKREKEIWDSLERVLRVCEEQKTDFLFIAGDLFHRQPLKRELRELNYMFSSLTSTKVIIVAGNHDYVRQDSYYRTFQWEENVHMLLSPDIACVEFPEYSLAVYGLSYHEKEIAQRLMERRQKQGQAELSAIQKSMRSLEKRAAELDRLIRSAYEDKVNGSIPGELCAELLGGYQKERTENAAKWRELEARLAEMQTVKNEVQEWISLIRQYQDIDTLDREMLLRLIDKIEVGEVHIEDGQKVRDIKIHYKFVGYIG